MAIEYVEIQKATNNFHSDMLLGKGGFGPVFKEWLHEHYLTAVKPGSGTAVAIKKLNIDESMQGNDEWMVGVSLWCSFCSEMFLRTL